MSRPPKQHLARVIILGVGGALLVVGFLASTTALALAPGLFLIVVGFTVPAFFQADHDPGRVSRELINAPTHGSEPSHQDESSERRRTSTTNHG